MLDVRLTVSSLAATARGASRLRSGSYIPPVIATRLTDAIAELAGFNDDPDGGRDHARGLHADLPSRRSTASPAGCATRVSRSRLDAVGNLFGRWTGNEPGRRWF